MNLLPATTITSAISPAVATAWVPFNGTPRNLSVQVNFVYGSGGTSVDCYLQTSLDGKTTAVDVANVHVTTASARKVFNVSAYQPNGTPASSVIGPDGQSPLTATDGAIGANSVQDGILGPHWRVKYQSSGTYGGGTTLQLDVQSADIPAFP